MTIFRLIAKPSGLGMLGVGFVLFRLFFAYADIDPEAINILKKHIAREYASYQLQREDISPPEKQTLMQAAEAVQLASVHARGNADKMVFRVEVLPNAAQPPHKPGVRYFRMRHELLTGYPDYGPLETDALIYFLALFKV